MDGYGEFTWTDYSKYLGMYVQDKKEGFGIFYWPSLNKVYAGFWKNGKQYGPGSLIKKNGTKFFNVSDSKKKKYKALWMFEKKENIPEKYMRFIKSSV